MALREGQRAGERERDREWGGGDAIQGKMSKMSAIFLTLKGNIGHVPLEEGKLSVSVISQCSEVTRNQRSE